MLFANDMVLESNLLIFFLLLSSIADNFDLTSSIEFDKIIISFSIGFKSTDSSFSLDIVFSILTILFLIEEISTFTSLMVFDNVTVLESNLLIFFLLSSIADSFFPTSSSILDKSKISFLMGDKSTGLFFIPDIISVNSKISNFISEISF